MLRSIIPRTPDISEFMTFYVTNFRSESWRNLSSPESPLSVDHRVKTVPCAVDEPLGLFSVSLITRILLTVLWNFFVYIFCFCASTHKLLRSVLLYTPGWANNAKETKSRVSKLQKEHCQVMCDVIPSSDFRVKWNAPGGHKRANKTV